MECNVCVIGGGLVGISVLRALSVVGGIEGCVLLERNDDVISGASAGNSGIFHTGFDAPAGSLELQCMKDGWRLFQELQQQAALPAARTGAIVVAWTPAELEQLPAIVAKAHANGVESARLLTRAELRSREPNLSSAALGGVLVPEEGIVDPWICPLFYLLQAQRHGAKMLRGCAVTGGRFEQGAWALQTTRGVVRAKVVVNCAGNHGDTVESINVSPPPFTVKPRKGQFVVYDTLAGSLTNAIILPVPTERTKGVLLARTVYGNLIVGPTAEEQDERDVPRTDQSTLRELVAAGERMLPGLKHHRGFSTSYAGIRPATQFKDYQIKAHPSRGWITVGGIRSTGLTASLGIADYVLGLFRSSFAAISNGDRRSSASAETLAAESQQLAADIVSQVAKLRASNVDGSKDLAVTVDGQTYRITHNVDRIGLRGVAAKL